jgi:pimeloyl-ACP methyl ester carboxylesterase
MRQIHRGIRTPQAEDATKPFSARAASVIASKTIGCQEPLISLQDDIAATKRILELQPGPCILVAHSYGGTVITEAGTDPHVIALVYMTAHEPDAGETEASNGKRFPSATSKTNAIEKRPDGYTYIDPAAFPQAFAADLPPEEAEFFFDGR